MEDSNGLDLIVNLNYKFLDYFLVVMWQSIDLRSNTMLPCKNPPKDIENAISQSHVAI